MEEYNVSQSASLFLHHSLVKSSMVLHGTPLAQSPHQDVGFSHRWSMVGGTS